MIKDKNKTSILLVSAIISAIVGSIITMFLQWSIEKIPIKPINIVLLSAVIVIVLSVLILRRIETIEEYRNEIMKDLVDGFIKIDKNTISDFATSLVKKSSFVRVVGTARQDVLTIKTKKAAKEYLLSLEEKLNTECPTDSDGFSYYRVVPKTIKPLLEQHIKVCAGNAAKTCNKFGYKEIDNFNFYISYQIFDDTDLLIIIDNREHDGESDNALCLWSRNKQIINVFINRFDDAWKQVNS